MQKGLSVFWKFFTGDKKRFWLVNKLKLFKVLLLTLIRTFRCVIIKNVNI